MELFLKLWQKTHLAFLPLHQFEEWKFSEHLNTFSIFCALGFVVISPLLSLFHFSLHEGSVLTLWDWNCKIRMEMCEMETSVYHIAVSTCTALSWLLSKLQVTFYLLVCFYFYCQLGLWMLLKAGRAAEVPHPYLCLEHSCSRSQKCGTREELNWASEARAVLWHCVSSGLGSVLRRIPTLCLWEQMNSGESKGKWGTTCGGHLITPLLTSHCDWGLTAVLP